MLKLINVFLFAAAFPFSSHALDKNGNFSSKEEQDSYIVATLNKMVVQINSQTPMMLNSETQMSNALALGKTINFTMRLINTSSKQVNANELSKYAKGNLNDIACKSKATKNLIDLGVSFVYIYFGNDDRMITRVVINNYHCG